MSMFDSMLRWAGLQRASKQGATRAYAAASGSRLHADWIMSSTTGNEEIRRGTKAVRDRARDLERNHDYVGRILSAAVLNVVGPEGFKIQCVSTNADGRPDIKANSAIEREFKRWSKATGFLRKQKLAIRAAWRDGEVFIRKNPGARNRWGFDVEMYESDFLDHEFNAIAATGNRIVMGIELNDDDERVAYHFWTRHPDDPNGGKRNVARVRIPAADIIHFYRPMRPGDLRAVSVLAPIMSRMKMLDGYMEAEVVAARAAAAKMGFYINTGNPNDPFPDASTTTDDGEFLTDAEPGTWSKLPTGWDIKESNPTHPNANQPAFIKANLRGAASGVGLSYNMLANDLEGVNLSSLRHGMLDERQTWMDWQRDMIDCVMSPIYLAWLSSALLAAPGEMAGLPASKRSKFEDHEWYGRRWAWIDPLKEIQALQAEAELGITPIPDIIRDRAKDPEDVIAQRVAYNMMLDAAGLPRPGDQPQPVAATANHDEDEEDDEKDKTDEED